jgi:hypothetical protein
MVVLYGLMYIYLFFFLLFTLICVLFLEKNHVILQYLSPLNLFLLLILIFKFLKNIIV